jgi:SulP family sulfate permease
VQGIFGGSAYNILGPAGALVNVLNKLSAVHGADIIPIVALFGGALGLTCFWVMGHRYFDEVENQVAVLEGFSLGVAVVIAGGQLNNALGLRGLPRHPEFYNNVGETFKHIGDSLYADYASFAIFFVILFCLNLIPPQKDATGRPKPKTPWIVVIAAVGLIYGVICNKLFTKWNPVLIIDAFPTITEENIWNFGYFAAIGTTIPWTPIIIGSIKVAFVAIFETLISAMIAQYKYTQLNAAAAGSPMEFVRTREIFGLSIGNMLSGALGGTPVTGVLVRTGVNIEYGGESRASQLINSVIVLVVTVALMKWFAFLPLSIVAAMLMNAAISLGKASLKIMMGFEKQLDVWTLVITAILCVMLDGAIGLAIGLVVRIVIKCCQGGFRENKDDDYKPTLIV